MSDNEAPKQAPRPVMGMSREESLASVYERHDIREGIDHVPGPGYQSKGKRISEVPDDWNEEFMEAYDRFMEKHPDIDEETWDQMRSRKLNGSTPGLAEAYANKDYDWYLERALETVQREREMQGERAYADVMHRQRLKARGIDIDGFNKFLKACEKAEKGE